MMMTMMMMMTMVMMMTRPKDKKKTTNWGSLIISSHDGATSCLCPPSSQADMPVLKLIISGDQPMPPTLSRNGAT
eukprot:3506296-Karenia_brevis.AAC.1